jgi:ATP-dependent exoDNAse (exonuclease V) beta subunit
MRRPDDAMDATSVCPGLHVFSANRASVEPPVDAAAGSSSYSVVWWDPKTLELGAKPSFGKRYEQLIGKDVESAVVERDRQTYDTWRAGRDEAIRTGSAPSLTIRTATEQAAIDVATGPAREETGQRSLFSAEPDDAVELIELGREAGRPAGVRYGALLHAVLATVPLDATRDQIAEVAGLQSRILGATDVEVASATAVTQAVLAHPLLRRASEADRGGNCRREVPITLRQPDGTLVEGIVDLAFRDARGWTVVDFKSDRELALALTVYRRQVGIYAKAIGEATGSPASAVLMRV